MRSGLLYPSGQFVFSGLVGDGDGSHAHIVVAKDIPGTSNQCSVCKGSGEVNR